MAKTLSQMPEMKKLCTIVSKWEDEGIKPRNVSPADMKALLYVFNDLFRYKKALFIQGALVKILEKLRYPSTAPRNRLHGITPMKGDERYSYL